MREQQTSVEWQFEQLFNSFEKFNNGEYTFAQYLSYNLTIFEQAKEMEKQEKLKVQIAENESVLEMLRLHGNDSSIMRVFSRLESLKEQLKEL